MLPPAMRGCTRCDRQPDLDALESKPRDSHRLRVTLVRVDFLGRPAQSSKRMQSTGMPSRGPCAIVASASREGRAIDQLSTSVSQLARPQAT
jgi:hypothetical protein